MPVIISVDGNIGSGKSRFIRFLEKKLVNETRKKVNILEEPVSIWESIKNSNGENMVECFYANQEKYAFSFQMMAYISRLSLLKEAIKNGYEIIISERSVYTDKNVFAKMLFDSKKIDELDYKVYQMWFDEFLADLPNFHYIYIKTKPEVAYYRVNKRARKGENIPIEYLQSCSEYHDNWLIKSQKSLDLMELGYEQELKSNILILDGNSNRDNEMEYEDWFKILENKYLDI